MNWKRDAPRARRYLSQAIATLAVATCAVATTGNAADATRAGGPDASPKPTIVLVHGAWADGSSWNRVILPLQQAGLNVLAAPIPLTSLSDDAAALNRTLARTKGPVLLAGHAYAGAVIAAAQITIPPRSNPPRANLVRVNGSRGRDRKGLSHD